MLSEAKWVTGRAALVHWMTLSWHTEVPGFRWLKRGQTLMGNEWMHWNHPNSIYSWHICSSHPQEFACSSIQTSLLRSLETQGKTGKQAQISYFGVTRNPSWLVDNHTKGTCFLPFSKLLLSPLAPWKQQCVSPSVNTCHPAQGEVVCTNTIEEKYWVIPRAWMLQIWK